MAQGFTNGVPYPLPVTKGGTGLVGTTINQILWSSAANTIAGLATANNSVLVTSAGGVPSLATVLPSGISAPNFQCPTFLDTNGNNSLSLFAYTSAVNYFQLVNSATNVAVGIYALGTDTNISMAVNMKGNGAFSVQNTTSANILIFQPALTTVAPSILVLGSDANISMNLQTKGTGAINIVSQALTTPLIIQSGTSSQHTANFAFTNAATTQTITFPDGDYTVTNSNNVYAISFIMSRGLY